MTIQQVFLCLTQNRGKQVLGDIQLLSGPAHGELGSRRCSRNNVSTHAFLDHSAEGVDKERE